MTSDTDLCTREDVESGRGFETCPVHNGPTGDPVLDRLLAEEKEIEARVHPPDPADRVEPRWWANHDNIVLLTSYLAEHDYTAADVAYAVEKPWKFEDQFREALKS